MAQSLGQVIKMKMKTHKIIKICIALLIVICAVNGLIGCQINGNIVGISDYYYEDSEKYSVGEAELTETVENIKINWPVGSVTIMPHNSNAVSFSENSQMKLTEDKMLHYYLDNTTLHIKFVACGKWDLSKIHKDLTILISEKLVLSNLKVFTLSANVKLTDIGVSENVTINTLSGETEAKFLEPLNEFNVDTTSGSFKIVAPSVSRFEAVAVSGDISLTAQKEPNYLNIDTTSGSIDLTLPESASFTLNYDTTSGDLYSDLSYRRQFRNYIFGDGNGEYKIKTVSGNVKITV